MTYTYIQKKNSDYNKTEIIEDVEISNINIKKTNNKGEIKLYKPVADDKKMFINSPENEITSIKYTGDLESNIKEQKISNQGGKIVFRYAINNIAQYVSEIDEQINYSKLLKMTNVNQKTYKPALSFNLTIRFKKWKEISTTIDLEIPTEGIIEEGTKGIEKTDLENIIFKRIEN